MSVIHPICIPSNVHKVKTFSGQWMCDKYFTFMEKSKNVVCWWLILQQVSLPTIIVERAGSYAWGHKSWRVREEFARTVTSAISLFASTELPLQRAILPPVCWFHIFCRTCQYMLSLILNLREERFHSLIFLFVGVRFCRCCRIQILVWGKLLFHALRLV